MIPLAMIVLDELRDDVPGVPLTDWNDAIEILFLERQSPRPSKKGRRLGAAGSELRAMPFEPPPSSASDDLLHEQRLGCGVDSRICTRRDARSMMKTV
jgi:hypothetical protein